MVEGDSSGEGGWPGHDLCVGWVGIRIYIRFRDMSYSPSKGGGGGTNIKPTTYCCDSTNEWAST